LIPLCRPSFSSQQSLELVLCPWPRRSISVGGRSFSPRPGISADIGSCSLLFDFHLGIRPCGPTDYVLSDLRGEKARFFFRWLARDFSGRDRRDGLISFRNADFDVYSTRAWCWSVLPRPHFSVFIVLSREAFFFGLPGRLEFLPLYALTQDPGAAPRGSGRLLLPLPLVFYGCARLPLT